MSFKEARYLTEHKNVVSPDMEMRAGTPWGAFTRSRSCRQENLSISKHHLHLQAAPVAGYRPSHRFTSQSRLGAWDTCVRARASEAASARIQLEADGRWTTAAEPLEAVALTEWQNQ